MGATYRAYLITHYVMGSTQVIYFKIIIQYPYRVFLSIFSQAHMIFSLRWGQSQSEVTLKSLFVSSTYPLFSQKTYYIRAAHHHLQNM